MVNEKDIAIKGGLWTTASTIATILSQFLRLIILTRFLEKTDFGLVAIINMVIGLCLTFTDLGFASAIMYKKDISQKEYSSLFWLQLIIFTLIFLFLVGTAPIVAKFYEEPLLATLIPIASLSVLFQAVGKLYDTILQKQYQFKTIAFRNISANIISLVLAIYLALADFGVYSLVLSTLMYTIILNLWNFISGIKVQKIILYFNIKDIFHLLKIGVFQTGTRILDFLSNKIDVMIIGKLLGTETLGIYDLAKNLVSTLVDLVRTVVSKVALPILSNNNDNDEAVKSRFLVMTKIVAYICIPICVSMAIFSRELIHIVYGDMYGEAVIIVTIFAFVSLFSSICSFYDMLGIAKGRTDLNFYSTVARVLIMTPIVFITSNISILYVVYGQLFATIIHSIVFWYIVVRKTYPIPFNYYFAHFSKWLYLQLLLFLVMKLMMGEYLSDTISFVHSVFYVAIYVILSGTSILIFMKDDIVFFKSLLSWSKK